MNISDYQLYRARNILKERWIESSPTTKTFLIENLIEGLNSECEFHIREDSRVLTEAAVFGDMLWWVKINRFPVASFAKRKLLLIYTFVKGSKSVPMWKKSMKIKVNPSKKDFHLNFWTIWCLMHGQKSKGLHQVWIIRWTMWWKESSV